MWALDMAPTILIRHVCCTHHLQVLGAKRSMDVEQKLTYTPPFLCVFVCAGLFSNATYTRRPWKRLVASTS